MSKTEVLSSKTKLTPAHAKRVIQDWIEDEDHVRSLQHWPDLAEAYEALKTFSESSFETPAPQGWMCACGTFNYAACCQECNTMQAETNCRHIAVDEPGSTLVYHGFVSGHIGDWRCTICNTLINDGKGRGGQKTSTEPGK